MNKNTPQQGVRDILPDFEWIDIPAGIVTLFGAKDSYIPEGQAKTFHVPTFAIAKYPVTNEQYAEYVMETGKKPKFWEESHYNDPLQPVVGVKWHDAIAFCDWLSEKSGDKILLPTEQQWQRAAQGDDSRTFPWGNLWDTSRCNSSESSIGKTTPVTDYEGKGDSPYGAVDMAGNVWEWCLTEWKTGSNDVNETGVWRLVRGGSWDNVNTVNFRCVCRNGWDSLFRYLSFGFRLSRSYTTS